jgi:hypothetical protein
MELDMCETTSLCEIPTPDFRSKCRNPAYYLVYATVVKSLQNPAWVFRGKVVSHMGWKAEEMHALQTNDDVHVIWTDTAACYLHLVTLTLSSNMHITMEAGLACTLF